MSLPLSAGAMSDMSTKPDDSHLFFPDTEPEQPMDPEMSDQLSAATDMGSASSSSSMAASHPLNNPKARAPPSNETPAKLVENSQSSEPVTTFSDEPDQSPSPSSSKASLAVKPKPDITLYFLQSSRSIRIAWLLEELGLDYKVVCFDREEDGYVIQEPFLPHDIREMLMAQRLPENGNQ